MTLLSPLVHVGTAFVWTRRVHPLVLGHGQHLIAKQCTWGLLEQLEEKQRSTACGSQSGGCRAPDVLIAYDFILF